LLAAGWFILVAEKIGDRLDIGFAPHTGAWLAFGCWHLAEAGCVFFITVNQVLVRLWARHLGHRPTFRRWSYLVCREAGWEIAKSDRQAVLLEELAA